jgi:hypothetical protein
MRNESHKVFYCPLGTRRVDMGRGICAEYQRCSKLDGHPSSRRKASLYRKAFEQLPHLGT